MLQSAIGKLTVLDAAMELEDLRVPLANQFEAQQGDRKGQYSIRVNGQGRFCFAWTESGPHDVGITDER